MPHIGVLITVPEPFGSRLQGARAAFGDRLSDVVPTHITLIPPTEVPDGQVDSICAGLDRAATATSAYPLRLRGTGTFRPVSDVVFIAVSEGISPTELLAQQVRTELGETVPDPEFPYHPHVTVAQDLDEPTLDRALDELADFDCRFTVDSFSLFQLSDATGWDATHRFDLRG